jgi:hypothetical protein
LSAKLLEENGLIMALDSAIPAKAGIHEHGSREFGTLGVHGFRPSPE